MQDWIYVWANGFDVTLELDEDYWPPASVLPMQWEQNRTPMLGYIRTPRTSVLLSALPGHSHCVSALVD